MQTWQMQEAKASLSGLVKRAETDGPQDITVDGRSVAVLLSRSNSTVLAHVKRWKAAHPQTVSVRSDELPIDVMSSLQAMQAMQAMRDRAAATGEARYAARLREAEDGRNGLAKENKQLLALNETLQTEAGELTTERDTRKGQVQSCEAALQALRGHIEREQVSAQAAVEEHDAVVARVAGAEAMAGEPRTMAEVLRELLKATEVRGGERGGEGVK